MSDEIRMKLASELGDVTDCLTPVYLVTKIRRCLIHNRRRGEYRVETIRNIFDLVKQVYPMHFAWIVRQVGIDLKKELEPKNMFFLWSRKLLMNWEDALTQVKSNTEEILL